MKINETILFEVFDTSYQTQSVGDKQFWFTTDEGEKYIINFIGKGTMESPLEISFNQFNATTNAIARRGEDPLPEVARSAMKIFSTVIVTVRKYVDKHQPEIMHFSGLAELGRIYDRMADRYAPRMFSEYKMYKQMKGRTMHFIFVRKEES